MNLSTNVIIGAGPAGMFCAKALKDLKLPFEIIEKEKFIGGLAATHKFGDSSFEIGPHIIYTQDQEILSVIRNYLGDDLIEKEWSVAQYIEGHFFKFPNSALEMMSKLGVLRMAGFLISYLMHRGRKHHNYIEFLYSKVGKKLAEFNVINYTKKMWGVSLDELETEWIKPRLDRLSLIEILKNTINPKTRTFLYPRHGSGQLYHKMSIDIPVRGEEMPIKIIHFDSKITKVISNKRQYNVNHLFSSLSLEDLTALLDPPPPPNVFSAISNLKYRSQIYVIIKFETNKILPYQWIYFNETNIPFCRIHEPKNFTDMDISPDESLLVVEYFCFEEDDIWQLENQSLLDLTMEHLNKIEWIASIKMKDYKVMKKLKAYPLMNRSRKANLKTIFSYLNQIENLSTIGRHGLHTYDNQDTAGRSSFEAVKTLKEIH